MIAKQELIEDLKRVKKLIGQIPSSQIYRKFGKYHKCTVERKFGGWNNALKQVFGETLQNSPLPRKVIKCLNCQKETKNNKFCTRSCAAIWNNSQRSTPSRCKRCNKRIQKKASVCRSCYPIDSMELYGEKIIGEFRKIPASKNRYQNIRNHAHRVAEYHGIKPDKCPLCDYSNHVELCHVKDISSFSDNTKLKIVNHPNNLRFLCPNHHWDLGHDKLKAT